MIFENYLPVKGIYLDQACLIYFHSHTPSAILSVYSSFLLQGYQANSTRDMKKKRKELFSYDCIHPVLNVLSLN